MKITTTKFAIVDLGTAVLGEFRDGSVIITHSGGCPAETILRGIRHLSDPQRLAQSILRRWVGGGDGYEGGWDAAEENRLYVSINDGQGMASA